MKMPVTGYDIEAMRPIAPSEEPRNTTALYRRGLGGMATGGAVGAGLGAYLSGRDPLRTAVGAGLGAGLGAIHGALKSRESRLRDQTTQERMEMRRALSDFKKQEAKAAKEKKAMDIDGVMLRAMQEELTAITKESELDKEAFPAAAVGNALGRLGMGVIGKGGKALSSLAGRGGRLGGVAQKAQQSIGRGLTSATKRYGAGNVAKGVGAATVGAGALGAGALGAGALASRRRRN